MGDDGTGAGLAAGAGAGGAVEPKGDAGPLVVGAMVAGWLCPKAFRLDPRKIAPARAARGRSPFRDVPFRDETVDKLRIIEGDP